MAFLRVVRQGHPIDPDLFVDLGPSVGRTVHTRGAIVGGQIVVAGPRTAPKWDPEKQRATNRRYYEKHRERLLREQREQRARAGW